MEDMISYQCVFMVLLSLLLAPGSFAENANIRCGGNPTGDMITGSDCTQALNKVKYKAGSATSQLAKIEEIETKIHRTVGSCTVFYEKSSDAPKGTPKVITKGIFEDSIKQMVDKCKGNPGIMNSVDDSRVIFGIMSSKMAANNFWDDSIPPLNVVCIGPESMVLVQQDCQDAFNALTVDDTKNDNLVNPVTKKPDQKVLQVINRCQATVQSTDGSPVTVKKASLVKHFQSVLKSCNTKPGVIFVSGGVSGVNGRLLIRATAPDHRLT